MTETLLNEKLVDPHEGLAYFRERFASREWWIVPSASEMSAQMVCAIEKAFYRGEASSDFELTLVPRPAVGVPLLGMCFFKKNRMTDDQLAAVFKCEGASLVGDDVSSRQDILITPDTPIAVLDWLDENFSPQATDN